MILRTFLCLGCCVGLEVISQLGDIVLLPNETLQVKLDSLFRGLLVDYQVKTATHSAKILINSQCQEIASVRFQETRQTGPAFKHEQWSYFVLFSAHLIEMWRLNADRGIEKEWEANEDRGLIAGMDVQILRDGVDLLYWTHSYLFFYVKCFPVGNQTSYQLNGIEVQPLMKVAVCSTQSTLLIASGISSLDTVTSYDIDFSSLSVSVASQNRYSEGVLDIVCTDSLYTLTSRGLHRGSTAIFPNEGNVYSLQKTRPEEFLIDTELDFVKLNDFGFNLFPKLRDALYLFRAAIDFWYYDILLYSNTYWILQLSNQRQEGKWVKIPYSPNSNVSISCVPQGPEKYPSIVLIDQENVLVYSLTMSFPSLQVKAASQPYELEVCAFDRLDRNELCQHATVRTLPGIAHAVLCRDRFNLTSAASPIHPVRIHYSYAKTHYQIDISNMFSGSNLEYSFLIPSIPNYLEGTWAIDIGGDALRAMHPIQMVARTTQCGTYGLFAAEAALVNVSHIEFINLKKKSSHLIERKWRFIPLYCIIYSSIVLIYGENQRNEGYLEFIALSQSELLISDKPLKAILVAENRVLGYSDNEVFEIQFLRRTRSSIFKTEQRIIDISGTRDYLWVLTSQDITRVGWTSQSIMSFLIDTVTRVVANEDVLVLYHNSNAIHVYQILSASIEISKVIQLDPSCLFLDFELSNELLLVKCKEFIQVISYSLPAHSSQLFTIKSVNSTIIKSHQDSVRMELASALEISCSRMQCDLIQYLIPLSKKTVVSLDIIITDTVSFGQQNAALIPVAISAVNDYNEKKTILLDIQLNNNGIFLAVNRSWSQFELSVPWTDSAEIDLSELFIGAEVSLMLNSTANSYIDLTEKHSEISSLHIGEAIDQVFDIYPDLNLIVYVWSDLVVFQQYLCAASQCQFTSPQRVSFLDLNVKYLSLCKVISHEQDSVLLYIEGRSSGMAEFVSRIVEYNMKSQESAMLFGVIRTVKEVFHVLRDNSGFIHVFRCSYYFFHYLLKWDEKFILVTKEVAKLDFFCFVTSIASVYIENEWKLYALDTSFGLLEFGLEPKFTLRNITQNPNWTREACITSIDGKLIVAFQSELDVYSIPAFQLIKRVEMLDDIAGSPVTALRGMSNLVCVERGKLTLLLDIEAAKGSEVTIWWFRSYARVISASQVVLKLPRDPKLHFLEFHPPVLSISPSDADVYSETVQFTVIGRNPRGAVTSPIFTLRRTSRFPYLWTAVILILSSFVILICCKYRKMRKQKHEEIEMSQSNYPES